MRRIVLLVALLAVIVAGWLWLRNPSPGTQRGVTAAPTIVKQPIVFASRTFDPETPPSEMPPLPPGELAQCDSNFISNANVAGEARRTDATHAVVTVTGVKLALQLQITIWAPVNATQHVMEHEDGHREISEYFYRNADKLAEQIAATYIGKQVVVTGVNLDSEISKALQQLGAEITEQYNKELNPEPTQLRYDAITDHSRNSVPAKEAVAQALLDNPPASILPRTSSKN